jgi:hypothetical protein
MEKDFKPVKSVYNTNFEAITNIMKLYGIEQFDLDCTYSKGAFWKDLPQPKFKSDIYPVNESVVRASSENLPFDDNSMKSIMYDPPFLITSTKTHKTNKEGSSIITKRFEGYSNFNELKSNYFKSLKELYRICDEDGYVVFKMMDTVSGGKNHFTHVMVMNMAQHIGFYPKDLFILTASNRINSFGSKWLKQMHSRKYHSYYFVFQKTKPKVNYDFLKYENEIPHTLQSQIIDRTSEELIDLSGDDITI